MGEANNARIPQLQAQNAPWSIKQDGQDVASGNWGTPAPPASALAEGSSGAEDPIIDPKGQTTSVVKKV